MAAINVSVAEAEVIGQVAAVGSVGLAILLVYTAISAVHWMREALGGGRDADPWEGYTAEDDARDRAAAGLEAVYARAAAMAAAGQGQSEDYGHAVYTEAYDNGYAGRRMGDVSDPAAMQAYAKGKADWQADSDAAHDELEDIERGER